MTQLTPVHDDIPDATVYAVDRCKHDVHSHKLRCLVNAKQAQGHASEDGEAILATIDQVRENIAGIVVTSDALECTPNARNSREEAKKSRMRAVTHRWFVPVACIQAEEKLKVTHGVRQRAKHVAKEEVAELDRIDSREQ